MKAKTLHIQKFLFAIVFTVFFCGISASGVSAATAEKKPGSQLDEIHAGNGVTCADCHGDNNQRGAVLMVQCLDCHDTTDLAKKTANVAPTNPHQNRHYGTEADCNLCHHQHKKSENFCLPCHARFDFVAP